MSGIKKSFGNLTIISADSMGLPERPPFRSFSAQPRSSHKFVRLQRRGMEENSDNSTDPQSPQVSTLPKRPFTSVPLSVSEGVEEKAQTSVKVVPGRPGFSGSKLKVAKKNYTVRPIVPAKKGDVVSVAEAMHKEKFGQRLKKLFDPETEAAIQAMQSGLYVGWRCPEYTWDCIRVGDVSKCFCGHTLREHSQYKGVKSQVPCAAHECRCRAFAFVPSRPEDVGEFWLQRRPGYDPSTWKAKCRCKHPHTDHSPTGLRQCNARECRCGHFQSNFLCAACDRHWEEHETYFDTDESRVQNGLPHGEDYLPFAEIPRLRNIALTGHGGNNSKYRSLTNGSGPKAAIEAAPVNNNTPVPFGYHKSNPEPFGP